MSNFAHNPPKARQLTGWLLDGAGNRFIVLERSAIVPWFDQIPLLAPSLCHLWDPPAEGVIVVDAVDDLHLVMDFWNPDGSTGMMCGNGGRCAALFAIHQQLLPSAQSQFTLRVNENSYLIERLTANTFRLQFPPITRLQYPLSLPLFGHSVPAGFVDNGSEHLVLWYPDVAPLFPQAASFETFPLDQLVPPIWAHPLFQERKVNVNLVLPLDATTLRIRTFERGVNAETAACGTGAIAAAAVTASRNGERKEKRYTVIPPSGDPLSVDLQIQNHTMIPALAGSATLVAAAEFTIENGTVHPVRFIPSNTA